MDKRIEVEFSQSALDTLMSLAQTKNESPGDALRAAIAHEKWITDTQKNGGKILVERNGEIDSVEF